MAGLSFRIHRSLRRRPLLSLCLHDSPVIESLQSALERLSDPAKTTLLVKAGAELQGLANLLYSHFFLIEREHTCASHWTYMEAS